MRRITFFALMAGALLLGAGLVPARTGAQPNPARSLVGQSITVCNDEFRFRITVVSADWRSTVSDRPAGSGRMWAVAIADMRNLGSDYGYPRGLVGVRDNRNRSFDWVLFNDVEEYIENEVANEEDVTPSWAGAEPGATLRVMIPFLVSSSATSFTLTPNNIGCGG